MAANKIITVRFCFLFGLCLIVVPQLSLGSRSKDHDVALEDPLHEALDQMTQHLTRVTRSTPSKGKKGSNPKPGMAKEEEPSPNTQELLRRYPDLTELMKQYPSIIYILNRLPETMKLLEKLPNDAVTKLLVALPKILIELGDEVPLLQKLFLLLDKLLFIVTSSETCKPILEALDGIIGAST